MPHSRTHRHDVPLRWMDMDSQAHVNNTVYADYLVEARRAAGIDGTVARWRLSYRRQLTFGLEPVVVATEVDGAVLRQEIVDTDGTAPYVTAETELGTPSASDEVLPPTPYDALLTVREGDLADGRLRDTATLVLFQESRIAFLLAGLDTAEQFGQRVVGSIDTTYLDRPTLAAGERLLVRSGIGTVTRSTFEIVAVLSHDDGTGTPGRPLAVSRTVLVAVDPQTRRSRPLDDAERARLTSLAPRVDA